MKAFALLFVLLGGTASAETLRIATGGHYPPYIYNPLSDQASGLDKDLLDEICERGAFDCTWVDLPMRDIFQALARGDVDVVTGGFGYSSARDALVDFTCPYVGGDENNGRFVALRDDVDLITSRIGALDQSLYLSAMQSAQRDVYAFDTEEEALDALKVGAIDVVFGSNNMLQAAQGRGGFVNIGAYPTFSGGTALAVSESASDLRMTLDALLADMSSDGTLGQIQRRWLGYDEGDVISRCLDLNALT